MTKETKQPQSGYLSWIIATLLFVAVAILFIQNDADVSLVVFWQKISIPKNFLIIICTLIGFFMGLILVLPGRWRLRRANRKLIKAQKEIDAKEKAYISTSNEG